MSQDASVNPILSHELEERVSSSSWDHRPPADENDAPPLAVESYADRLMDDLFEDVERMLHRGGVPQPEPEIAPPATAAEPLSQPFASQAPPPLSLETALTSLSLSESGSAQAYGAQELDHSVTSGLTPPKATLEQNSPRRSYNRLLLGVGCISVLVALAVWLVTQEAQRQPATTQGNNPSQTAATNGLTDSRFAQYMERSLQNIAQQPQATAPKGGTPAAANMPTVTIPKTPTPPAPKTPAGLERVYVPTYQLPPNLATQGNTAPAPATTVVPATPNQRAAVPTAPVPPTASVPRSLIGVMELGENSAALFEINGITQRYRIGESIGSSGWTLVEISKNQAIIRRNGEVRTIFIGQSF